MFSPLRRMRVVSDPTARSQRGRHPCFGLIGWHTDVDVREKRPRPGFGGSRR